MTERQIDNSLWDFPKLKDVASEGPIFDMKCPSCQAVNIELKPISVSWRTQEDNKDLGEVLNRFYEAMPLLQDAILIALQQQKGLLVVCNHCKTTNEIFIHIDRSKLNRWLGKKY